MKFSVATFNVENLITANRPIYEESHPRFTSQGYELKISWIKSQLLKMNADIIGFQEIFEEKALRDCLTGTTFENWHLFVAKPTGIRPVNAILSRFPILRAEVIEGIPFVFDFFDENALDPNLESTPILIPINRFSRGVLMAEIQLTARISMLVCVVHLKSKRPTLPEGITPDSASYFEAAKGKIRSLIRRGIESAGIRQILSDEIAKNESKPIIILGDLNDNDTAVTSQAILGEPPFHQLPVEEKINRWKHVFQNSKDVQARKSIENYHYTYIHNGHYESLDNIFISNHFAELNTKKIGRIIDVRLYNDHIIDKTISSDRKPFYVTDHGQVVANINLFEHENRSEQSNPIV
ncbi:endonuclease/exonuclease/phosphatase family protein [Rhodocytophaga rosea]|uniref:Endonuclease/exonuclease/phosphatase family protein n=1 Tax=Rhodocytophaga rosea TaxID=2704465 RepID=A0A6C0GT54_9BACT|nr:endonuclease/exonuclease/phosphatase family protein [Rhodocytophaga rosea]QHT70622.1 endonuclease/exonuclease/phosphatase family protein [Rhodocytophaga rosea]